MLLCQTELTTSQQVLAHLDFKLPDGANQSGELGTAKIRYAHFSPCFAELHPPLVLNSDDRTSPAVVFRNHQLILAIDEFPEISGGYQCTPPNLVNPAILSYPKNVLL